MDKWGWDELDIILVTGDAFIDHPSYGVAMISRVLERAGFRVGIIAQPNPLRDMEFAHLKKPRLFFWISSGCRDSMEANHSPNKKRRKFDNYTPGRVPGKRPDHALTVYSQTIRRLFPDTPIVIGDIEASIRRLAHFDYWDNEIKKSALAESEADLLVYGTGERQAVEIAKRLDAGKSVNEINDIRGTCWKLPMERGADIKHIIGDDYLHIPSFEQVYIDRDAYLEAFRAHYFANDPYTGKHLVQEHPASYIIQNPPQYPFTTEEMDDLFTMDFIRTPHPRYKRAGAIANFETVKFRLNTHRGCFAGCGFCANSIHQGRYIQSRSAQSVIDEAKMISGFHYFRGVVSNIGGPTGNMWQMSCKRLKSNGTEKCERPSCTFPDICENLDYDHGKYIDLIKSILNIPAIEKVFIDTGLRYDILLADSRGPELLDLVLSKCIQVNFKVAIEHVSSAVTSRIRKYHPEQTVNFIENYLDSVERLNLRNISLLPRFIAGHPGSSLNEAIEAAQFMKRWGIDQNNIQDFVPMPMTPSTCMFYTGIDPFTNEKVYRPLAFRERKLQRALLHYFKPQNERYVFEALEEAGRTELIGSGPQCLLAEEPKVFKF